MDKLVKAWSARRESEEHLLNYPGVVGVGVGNKKTGGEDTGEVGVTVLVERKSNAIFPAYKVPASVNGVPTDVIQVGRVSALSYTVKRRPVPGGVSVGHYKVSAGTLGVWARTERGDPIMLSNNHVLANSNEARIGDPILQPGVADGGGAGDTIASLEKFVPIQFFSEDSTCRVSNSITALLNLLSKLFGSRQMWSNFRIDSGQENLMDAAIAVPLRKEDVDFDILDIGKIAGYTYPTLGMEVQKTGRTTGHTTGKVEVMDTTIQVGYGGFRNAVFKGQVVSGAMSAPGDSGSLIVAPGNKAVGLLFAGSEEATIWTPISFVMNELQIVL